MYGSNKRELIAPRVARSGDKHTYIYALSRPGKRVTLCYIVGHYNGCIQFQSNYRYHCIQKTILNGDVSGDKAGLCFNDLNTQNLTKLMEKKKLKIPIKYSRKPKYFENLISHKNSRFSVPFFCFSDFFFFKLPTGKFFASNLYNALRIFTLPSKLPSKFEIEAWHSDIEFIINNTVRCCLIEGRRMHWCLITTYIDATGTSRFRIVFMAKVNLYGNKKKKLLKNYVKKCKNWLIVYPREYDFTKIIVKSHEPTIKKFKFYQIAIALWFIKFSYKFHVQYFQSKEFFFYKCTGYD
ncbi:hypothetical protein AGLY_009534 [Aphis glycines]|uniref:Uncharacterized protein n=1 Tax=Aphis glycines TaxID=307491 RepID=A0A6G0THQ7_APHGL|nr:hypothetical protein AGLY_009534 [Aphis glycines]